MRTDVPPVLITPAYTRHARRLVASYHHWTGEHLIPPDTPPERLAETLFRANFAIVSHGTESDPVFNFGNAIALSLFEMTWDEFTRLPSRLSADPATSEERESLMARVSSEGFVRGYRGIRVSSSGRRFVVAGATVWEVLDRDGRSYGRAARFEAEGSSSSS
jgi:hypothetical protein